MKRERASGVNAVESVLSNAAERVIQIWIAGRGKRLDRLIERARSAGIAVQATSEATLSRLADGTNHQGVVAELRASEPVTETVLDDLLDQADRDALVLVLDQVQDPHNLGACLRSAAGAGATAVVVPRDRAAGLTPAARRAAAGAAEILPLVEVANIARCIERMQRAGVWCTGLAGEADTALQHVDLTGPTALVLGGEERGLRRLTRERCDTLARIPISEDIESLNVSVAAGIGLFESRRQRNAE
ncbi:MAG: 23S rRNA (guanosine(2251)-2'-O)-methyltransferase RlmB [Candidatus Wenzhouxiangella sp. M2_3B_020]